MLRYSRVGYTRAIAGIAAISPKMVTRKVRSPQLSLIALQRVKRAESVYRECSYSRTPISEIQLSPVLLPVTMRCGATLPLDPAANSRMLDALVSY